MSGTTFLLAPCTGVGKALAVVTRRAACLVHQAHLDTTVLLSMPALLAGDRQQRRLVRGLRAILINGCAERCASHVLADLGIRPVAVIDVVKVLAEVKSPPGKARQELQESGKQLAVAVAERIQRAMNGATLRAAGGRTPLSVPPRQKKCACMSLASRTNGRTGNRSPPAYVTLLPCQGIRRSGGRVTQRAAYILDEERFPGKTALLCIPALAATVQEDVDMLEQFPTVAINGCGAQCATKIAGKYGVKPAVSVDLNETVPGFDGGHECALPDLTDEESKAAVYLADAVEPAISDLLAGTRQEQRERAVGNRKCGPVRASRLCKGSGGASKTS